MPWPGLGNFIPGQILLAQDPRHLSRYWAVAVAGMCDLPVEVACGGVCALGAGPGFPLTMQVRTSTSRMPLILYHPYVVCTLLDPVRWPACVTNAG